MSSGHARPVSVAAGCGEGSGESIFIPLETVLVRAPLLPVESYRALSRPPSGTAGWVGATLADPRARLALAVGSRSLSEALARDRTSGGLDDRVKSKLLRYVIRMSSRPTPYGMFAGVCLARLDRETDFRLSGEERRRIRPDMAWLSHLISTLESLPEVRDRLRVAINPAAYVRAGRFVLAARSTLLEAGRAPEVSIRATGGVRRALDRAQRPVAYADLRDELLTVAGATPEKVSRLLASLLEQTFLISELRPPLTAGSPAQHVLDRLAGIDAARTIRDELRLLLEEASAWEMLPAEEALSAYPRLVGRSERLVPREAASTPFQVDLFLSPSSTRINRAVGDEVCRAAEILLRLTPHPEGPPALAAYRQSFQSRFGVDREVPLLELLDAHPGLGAYSPARAAYQPSPAVARRGRVLFEIAAAAQRALCPCIDLDEALLSRLGVNEVKPDRAPASLDLSVFIAARSPQALDSGDFTIVVGPNLGAMAAGRVAGRFAGGLGDAGVGMLQQIAAAEEASRVDLLWAELVYLPERSRAANVSVRPGIRGHEIPVGLHAGRAAAQSIPLREIVVGVRDDRFYLRWSRTGQRIRVSSGHMLNSFLGSDVCRFLSDVGYDGEPLLVGFDWGRAEPLPYLPRVRSGRVVLRPAEWKVDYSCRRHWFPSASPAAFAVELDRWRRTWAVPRHVFLTMADNRLLLDLDDAVQAAELRMEITRLTDGAHLVLQEVVPALDDVWARGPAGGFYTELCVSMVRRPPASQTKSPDHRLGGAAPAHTSSCTGGQRARLLPPGSEWAYVKVYCGPDVQNDLLVGPVRELTRRLLDEGIIEDWFFIRYTDPDHHLRLRFRCSAPDARLRLFAELCAWATALLEEGRCSRFAFDTYDREIERYGGSSAIMLAEQIFGVDSSSVVEHLAVLQRNHDVDPRDLVVATTDNLLSALAPREEDVLRWLCARRGDKRRSSDEYRKRKSTLRSYVAPRDVESAAALPAEIRAGMERAHERLRRIAAELTALRRRSLLLQPMDYLLASFAHMHFNRMAGPDAELEQLTLALLHRTRDAMAHAGYRAAG
ncbi:lantibiotic dehydratase [Sorangium sp. So ce1335]|uniref:lantibiotic dehydratase n=1 Tax=Sorangium sp. So ce1335 TaxID=3133335 RepID=UPI003F61FD05